jgi:hypothetical protein
VRYIRSERFLHNCPIPIVYPSLARIRDS